MKLKSKLMAAAVALVVASGAQATSINTGTAGNGNLFLNLSSSSGSYTRNLNYTLTGADAGTSFAAALSAAGNIDLSWAADSTLTTWLGQQTTPVEMNLFALDASGARGLLTTYKDPKPATVKASSSIHSAIGEAQQFLSYVNPSLGSSNSATFAAGTNGWAGKTKPGLPSTFNDDIYAYLNFKTTSNVKVGSDELGWTYNKLDLMLITAASTASSTPSVYTTQKDGGNAVQAYFDVNNTFHIAAVPEPSEYALMLAGLGMLGFMARRRLNNRA